MRNIRILRIVSPGLAPGLRKRFAWKCFDQSTLNYFLPGGFAKHIITASWLTHQSALTGMEAAMAQKRILAGTVLLLTALACVSSAQDENPKIHRLNMDVDLVLALGLAAQNGPNIQNSPAAPEDDFTLNVNVHLVQLPVSVTSRDGKSLDSLPRSSFQVYEDNVLQEITLFKHEDVPVSLGLVIDNSGSMRNKRQRVNSAALSFVRESNPNDQTFIVDFDDEVLLRQDFTGKMSDLVGALRDIHTQGQTALNDAVYVAIDHVKTGTRDKKALLVISDGEDNKSKYGINRLLDHVRDSKDVSIYTIGLLEENDYRGGLFGKSPSKKARESLRKIAELSGGEAYFPKSVEEVSAICSRIARDLRNQYTLGYSPKNTKNDGGYRSIRVNVTPPLGTPKLTVRTKPGYTAPSS
jgi:VWFA-related protein